MKTELYTDFLLKRIGSTILRFMMKIVFALHNRIDVKGLENLTVNPDCPRRIFIANHVSFVDAAILATYLPRGTTFAVNLAASKWWWMRIVMPFFPCLTLDTRNPMAIKTLVNMVKGGAPIVIFPEGRLTVTNGLMKIYEGAGLIADKADAEIIPVRLEGIHFSPLSRLKKLNPVHFGHQFTMTVLPPRKVDVEGPFANASQRRAAIGDFLYDQMASMMAGTEKADKTLYTSLIDAMNSHGGKTVIAENINPLTQEIEDITYKKFVIGTMVLGEELSYDTMRGDYVGVLLPNGIKTAITFFSLLARGRVPALLNFTTGPANISSAMLAGNIKTVVTSRAFVEMAKLQKTIEAIQTTASVVYLEDVGERIGWFSKLLASWNIRSAQRLHNHYAIKADDPAVVIFTSGSEGIPKGVVLSHRNILSNIYQLAACVDFSPADIVFNAMPMFHSFGLTAGTILPILNGIKVFLFPNPLNFRAVPELIYDRNATIMFGTDTFLNGYAKKAHRADLRSIRYIFAGAEKVQDATRQTFNEKFQRAIYEGYGATECAPAISMNTPMNYRSGAVGRVLPNIEYRIVPMAGIQTGGVLHVRGPNIMKGYLKVDQPGVIQPLADGWYDTGDIVNIDKAGFITIQGRAKRFAKIAGEMIALPAVEALAKDFLPQNNHAIVAIKDDKKGEALVMFSTASEAELGGFPKYITARGMTSLAAPKKMVIVEAIPVLGTGKTDYVSLQKMAEA